MSIERPTRAAVHALLVFAGYSLWFAWLFSGPLLRNTYAAESDLYEYYLPIFLAPITTWSSFEFSGLPAFADPGDFTTYPLHYLFARVIGSWTGFIISAFVLASAFTYAYVYRVTRSRTAAAFAGLAYGMSEAMLERIPHLGTLHCFVWLPLIVLAIDHVRDGERPRLWVAIGAVGLACAFLSGHPQPAIYTYYATALYAVATGGRPTARFYTSIAAMFAISMLLAAHKALPLVEASTVMARQLVNYGQFTGHANTATEMLSVLFPTVLHDGREAPTYVGLATVAFALIGISRARMDRRAMFWIAAALFALLMGMGDSTPVARITYAVVPLYTKFRVGARHLFLFAFGAAFLAGTGIAAVQRGEVSRRQIRTFLAIFAALIAGAAALQAIWPGAIVYEVRRHPDITLPVWTTGVWVQLLLATAIAVTLWMMSRTRHVTPFIIVAAVLLVADDLYAFPSPVTLSGFNVGTIPRVAASPSVHAERIGRELEPLHQRVLALGGTQNDAVVPAAFARLWKIPIAGGYGPMLLQRYSDLATMGTNGSVRPGAIAPPDVALDMLAVRYLLVQPADVAAPPTFDRNGVSWAVSELGMPVGRPDCGHDYPRSAFIPMPPDVAVAAIAVVTHLRCSEDVPQDAEVMRLRVQDGEGSTFEQPFRAGHETAETGLRDQAIAARGRHHVPASAFDDPAAGGLRFLTKVSLPHAVRGGRVVLDAPGTNGWITIDRLTLIDEAGVSHPQSAPGLWLRDTSRWREVRRFSTSRFTDRGADENSSEETPYTLFENLRAMPGAWIVSEATPVSDADALEAIRRSQLPHGVAFDPRVTALVDPQEGGAAGPFQPGASKATIEAIDDGRIRVRVSTAGGGFLVVSEQDYPGWRARIDNGSPVAARRANLALMGIEVPPGDHVVEFELISNTQRAGMALSLGGVLVCALLVVADRRRVGSAATHVS